MSDPEIGYTISQSELESAVAICDCEGMGGCVPGQCSTICNHGCSYVGQANAQGATQSLGKWGAKLAAWVWPAGSYIPIE